MNIQTKEEFLQVYKASTSDQLKEQELDQDVLEIISGVRKDGDEALYRYTNKFDHVVLDSLIVSEEELLEAKKQVDAGFLDALKQAKENIEAFHKEQKEQSWFVNKAPGILLGQKVTPIEKVGVYVPGGKAAYPSTV